MLKEIEDRAERGDWASGYQARRDRVWLLAQVREAERVIERLCSVINWMVHYLGCPDASVPLRDVEILLSNWRKEAGDETE